MVLSPRHVRFHPDFGAALVWDASDGLMLPLRSLPITDELRRDLLAWVEVWEAAAWLVIDEDPELEAQGDRALTDIWPRRLELVERLQRELGPGWTVTLGPRST